MTLEELAQSIYEYIDIKIKEVKEQILYSPGKFASISLSELENAILSDYSGHRELRHDTMRLLIRKLSELGVDSGFGNASITSIEALNSLDTPGGYSVNIPGGLPGILPDQSAMLVLPQNEEYVKATQLLFYLVSGKLVTATRSGMSGNWSEWIENTDTSVNLSSPLEKMPQLLYRNLEGDNMLAPSDFEGRLRPIETPMLLVYKNEAANEVILCNCPSIHGLISNPSEWMMGFNLNDYTKSINSCIRITSAEYIGEYGGYSYCVKLGLKTPTECPSLHRAYITSFLAGGLNLRWDPAFKASMTSLQWDRQIVGCGYSWKSDDGKYRAFVTGVTNAATVKRTYITKVFSADDRLGEWTNDFGTDSTGVFDGLLPYGYEGFTPFIQGTVSPTNKNAHIMVVGLYNSSSQMTALAMLQFNDDLTYRKLSVLDIDYIPTIGFSSIGFGLSTAFYKGKYLFSIQDGTHNTGKRVVLSSKNLAGPYDIHSTIFDYTTDTALKQFGSMVGNSIANSTMFVWNNELYCISSGEAVGLETGTGYKHEAYLWKFDDSDATWNFVKGPVLLALHGLPDNYPEYPAIGANVGSGDIESGGWASAHMGFMSVFGAEGHRLWIGYAAKGWGQHSASSYQATVGYINLLKAFE